MTDRTLRELAGAEIVPNMGSQNAWLVRFGEGEYDTINKSAKHTLLVKDDVATSDTVSYGGIMVDFDLQNDEITIHDGDNEVRVPSDKHSHVLWAVHDEDGDRLNKLFDELYSPTVREGLMDQFMPRFRRNSDEIHKTDDGWLLNGDILVSWDASNHPVNVAQAHVVNGSTTVEADEDKEARDIDFLPPNRDLQAESYQVTAPDGRTFDLEEVELRFLTTVGLILDRNPDNYADDLCQTIGDSGVVAFTDEKSGLHHSHPPSKHDCRDLGVTEEAVDMLWSNSYDHTGVVEMSIREQEFRNAPFNVFEDSPNDDTQKWEKIASTKEKAPIPQHIRSMLEDMYE